MSELIPGAEPFSHEGTNGHGALVVHGFTGNPQSMRPLAEAFAHAGYTVELPLLPGHGTKVEDMLETGWDDWSGAAEAAYATVQNGDLPAAVARLERARAIMLADDLNLVPAALSSLPDPALARRYAKAAQLVRQLQSP